jgi:hypothetical protein
MPKRGTAWARIIIIATVVLIAASLGSCKLIFDAERARTVAFVRNSLEKLETGTMPVAADGLSERELSSIQQRLGTDFPEELEVQIVDSFLGILQIDLIYRGNAIYQFIVDGPPFPLSPDKDNELRLREIIAIE